MRTKLERYSRLYIVPYLGDWALDRLTRKDIEDWRDALGSRCRANTVNTALGILRSMLRDAEI